MMHGEGFETMAECATAEMAKEHTLVRKYGTNIFRDGRTGRYYADGAASTTMFGIGRGGSETEEPVAKITPTGEVIAKEPKLKVGDRYFLGGTIYEVVSIGRDEYNHYTLKGIQRDGARMPSFRKQMRDAGYAIVMDNPAKREIIARRVAA